MLAHESLANGKLSHGYTHVRRGERHPRASKREGEYTSQRMWLVLPAAACFLWRSSKPPLHLPGDTLALCVFCMPLISPKVRSERRGLGASSGCCVPRHTSKQNSFRFCFTKKCPKAREKRVLIGVTVRVKKRVLIRVTVWVSVVRSQDLRHKTSVTRSPSQDLRRKIGVSVWNCRG